MGFSLACSANASWTGPRMSTSRFGSSAAAALASGKRGQHLVRRQSRRATHGTKRRNAAHRSLPRCMTASNPRHCSSPLVAARRESQAADACDRFLPEPDRNTSFSLYAMIANFVPSTSGTAAAERIYRVCRPSAGTAVGPFPGWGVVERTTGCSQLVLTRILVIGRGASWTFARRVILSPAESFTPHCSTATGSGGRASSERNRPLACNPRKRSGRENPPFRGPTASNRRR